MAGASASMWEYQIALDDRDVYDIVVSREHGDAFSWAPVTNGALLVRSEKYSCTTREQALDAAVHYIEQMAYIERHGADA
ncbi:MAG: hypothetical protein NVS2B16_16410 [Chloroflexota bacterium]